MPTSLARRAILPIVVLAGLCAPAAAHAYRVTVHVHGAGRVVETTPAALMDCTTAVSNAEWSVSDCLAGLPSGGYGLGWIVELTADVPPAYYDRGWRFQKWVDSSAAGRINCDPQDNVGDHVTATCKFQIAADLQTDLYFDDVLGPQDTTVSGGPAAVTKATAASFTFGAPSDPDASFECKLDRPGQPALIFVPCGSPSDKGETYAGLTTNGTYTFTVRAKDPSGNVDNTPASRTWRVDTVAPTVSIAGTPAGGALTNSTTADFTVSSTEGMPSCSLDGIATPCGGVKAGLADGAHTFSVTATDAAGNTGRAARSWVVDTVAAAVTITGGPAAGTTTRSRSATFTLSSSKPASFECSLDARPFSACGSPVSFSSLGDGRHSVAVRARDSAGNVSAPATRTWTVDATPPQTDLLGGPAEGSSSASTTATFNFGSSEPAASFECRLDGAAFTSCTSPVILSGLVPGAHVFEVRATDRTGNQDATPARRAWRVRAPAVRVAVAARWKAAKALTQVRRLRLTRLERGTVVTVTCKGRGCPLRSRVIRPSRTGTVDVRAVLKRRPLRAGAMLTIRVARAQRATKLLTFRVRKGRPPAATTRVEQ